MLSCADDISVLKNWASSPNYFMSPPRLSDSAILYKDADRSVFLIDIPQSIALAQNPSHLHHPSSPIECVPYSVSPLTEPYPSVEPKQTKSQVYQNQLDTSFPLDLLGKALVNIKEALDDEPWCLHRQCLGPEDQILNAMASARPLFEIALEHTWSSAEPLKLSSSEALPSDMALLTDRLICNETLHTVKLGTCQPTAEYFLPPLSTFLLSTITSSSTMSFSMSALQQYPAPSQTTSAGPGEFDIIVMDPPWPNRSVRRSRQYQTTECGAAPIEALKGSLGQHIGPSGIVACWITNKAAVRETALNLFAAWGLTLIEEWAWLKVTRNGDSMCSLDGTWRKPYEILLIGCRDAVMHKVSTHIDVDIPGIRRRVVAAVPDLHSRKPSLKELLERLFIGEAKPYRAVELFARNLTAGWWAWGDEVLKYNDTKTWSRPCDE